MQLDTRSCFDRSSRQCKLTVDCLTRALDDLRSATGNPLPTDSPHYAENISYPLRQLCQARIFLNHAIASLQLARDEARELAEATECYSWSTDQRTNGE